MNIYIYIYIYKHKIKIKKKNLSRAQPMKNIKKNLITPITIKNKNKN